MKGKLALCMVSQSFECTSHFDVTTAITAHYHKRASKARGFHVIPPSPAGKPRLGPALARHTSSWLYALLSVSSSHTSLNSTAIMPRFLCYCPDYPDALERRLAVRPDHLVGAKKDWDNGVQSESHLSPLSWPRSLQIFPHRCGQRPLADAA